MALMIWLLITWTFWCSIRGALGSGFEEFSVSLHYCYIVHPMSYVIGLPVSLSMSQGKEHCMTAYTVLGIQTREGFRDIQRGVLAYRYRSRVTRALFLNFFLCSDRCKFVYLKRINSYVGKGR